MASIHWTSTMHEECKALYKYMIQNRSNNLTKLILPFHFTDFKK